jgi:[ribosomal protein S5]-alanine N-acetyltransferase
MKILETTRLILREMTTADAEHLYLLNRDPEVIRYTGDKPFTDIQESERFLSNYDHYTKYGFGRWAVISKTDHMFLGWCGLKYTPELDEYDIGFRFFKAYWNMGYATESATASVETGFTKFGINEIVGRSRKENTASIRVLEKLRFTFLKEFDFNDHEGVIYSKSK